MKHTRRKILNKNDYLSFDEAWPVLQIAHANSSGWYSAICPAHADERPSLGVKEGEYGELVVNCFSGCKTIDVINAIRKELY